ncbi:4-hydroxy-tetrahydrodipicolinate synthase [Rhodoferax sp. AJA081-3]|uniref:4-hydroxy-tetrahydrodipicolinate synthase n=1 Tax=Rhodoferax sp. AJA081-3 TaxID=2752316 RepID=UPI001AE0D0CF|nr:4-hydroxy-tetrahydrodipicolinate synthase [Rhodoferax sp. AJA081-3]QTN28833.1 4-hydroxy-tetrahydrodipicolinate synthase [Rhodoferax sp. AJA081-3]
MPSSRDFSGLWIPLITPFAGESVDHPALTRLVKHYAAAGVHGFVACGSTGEAAALDKQEQLAVLDTVLAAAGPLPVVMGLSGYHLVQTVAWVKELAQRPIAGLLVPAPHYIRPSQAGLVQWFTALADASDKPLVVYDIPYRTGATLALDTLLTLAAHPHIQAIKDCGGDAGKTQALITDGRLQVLAGEDAQVFSTLALGGAGSITASAHLCTSRFVAVMHSLRRGDLPHARALWQPLVPLINAVFAEPNPAVIKAMLAQQGLVQDGLRLPMTGASLEARQRVHTMVDKLALD